jgi:hypothetical protein
MKGACEHKKAEQLTFRWETYHDRLGHEQKELVRHMWCHDCKQFFGRTDWEATAKARQG